VHGMWEWSPADLSRISTVRVRNREIIAFHFSAEDLENLYFRIASVNFKIRYPRGVGEFAKESATAGMYISRRFLAMMSGHDIVNDWQTTLFDSDESE